MVLFFIACIWKDLWPLLTHTQNIIFFKLEILYFYGFYKCNHMNKKIFFYVNESKGKSFWVVYCTWQSHVDGDDWFLFVFTIMIFMTWKMHHMNRFGLMDLCNNNEKTDAVLCLLWWLQFCTLFMGSIYMIMFYFAILWK